MPKLPPNMRPDAFAGLADDYARYRLPYPRALLEELMAEARLPAKPRLLDLACGRECGQADAVGFGSGEYEFTHWLERPALVKAALLAPGGPAASDWGSHGLRLFTITV